MVLLRKSKNHRRPSGYKNLVTETLPLHHCQSTYCTNQAEYWHGRIVCINDASHLLIGWCNICNKYVCTQCALKVGLSKNDFIMLSDQEQVPIVEQSKIIIPTLLHCKRCGTVLQKGKYNKIYILLP